MQPSPHDQYRSRLCLLLAGCLWSGQACADTSAAPSRSIDFQKSGVRFQISASVRADPASSYARQTYGQSSASLAVRLRISAHARESHFFGEIAKDFFDFRTNEGAEEIRYWEDPRCHQRRGLPKTTVVAIDGSIVNGDKKIEVRARPRQLGVLLPSDEITQGRRLSAAGAGRTGTAIVYRSRSKASHLLVDVKIVAFDCDLRAEGRPPGAAAIDLPTVPAAAERRR
jgi:hypothetical protein